MTRMHTDNPASSPALNARPAQASSNSTPTAPAAPTACILCSRNCGLTVQVDGRKLTRIKGDSGHPLTQGYICQKAARLDHYQNHSDRLTTPLKRHADGSFKAISWDQALTEIAGQLVALRDVHGGDAFAFAGGGGQGNHLGAAYNRQLLAAMKSRYSYNSLGQEKTGDFWLNGRLFGRQTCHTTEDVEHADYVLFIGCNPYQAHGIPNARDTLKHIRQDPARTMVVIDPRRTETAQMADIHLQLKPGTDAFLMSALIGVIVQEKRYNEAFLKRHTHQHRDIIKLFQAIPVAHHAAIADVDLEQVRAVARGFAGAKRGCVRVDLGIQHSPNTTLNGWLEKLLYLLCGHFGRQGTNNLHTMFLPILGHTDERRVVKGKSLKRTAFHKMMPISGIYPPNILPDEILKAGEQRIRSVFVDSCNPVATWANTTAFENAFKSLDLLVVVDVAMTETARLAHYVLPAATQFEKWECTGFNLEFPTNAFHLRRPVLTPVGDCLPEAEIYTRLLEKMGVIEPAYPLLETVAAWQPGAARRLPYMAALALSIARNPRLVPFAASILYRTLGPYLTTDDGHPAAETAFLLPLAMDYARRYRKAIGRTGLKGNALTLGLSLFEKILNSPSGTLISRHEYDEVWQLMGHRDRKVTLMIDEMVAELKALKPLATDTKRYPFILMAGERRIYNANQIYRDPAWRKSDRQGAMRIHPDDAQQLGVKDDEWVEVKSATGQLHAQVQIDDTVRSGVVTLPHGYGQVFGVTVSEKDSASGSSSAPTSARATAATPASTATPTPNGPQLNRLAASDWCDPLTRTPFHKYVPVSLVRMNVDSSVGQPELAQTL